MGFILLLFESFISVRETACSFSTVCHLDSVPAESGRENWISEFPLLKRWSLIS